VIDFVDGAGNSTTSKDYEYRDYQAYGGNYYRLNQLDLDGTSSYSQVVYVENLLVFEAYPNPIQDKVTLRLGEYSSQSNQILTLEIIDTQGRTTFRENNTLENLENSCSAYFQKASAGSYILQLSNQDKKYIKKVMKR
jgi:hypothetical protein